MYQYHPNTSFTDLEYLTTACSLARSLFTKRNILIPKHEDWSTPILQDNYIGSILPAYFVESAALTVSSVWVSSFSFHPSSPIPYNPPHGLFIFHIPLRILTAVPCGLLPHAQTRSQEHCALGILAAVLCMGRTSLRLAHDPLHRLQLGFRLRHFKMQKGNKQKASAHP